MQISAGPVVTGENFYKGRQNLVVEFGRLLATGDVLVAGPRRTGKTSLIKEHCSKFEAETSTFIYIDLENVETLYELYTRIIKELTTRLSKRHQIFANVADFLKSTSTRLSKVFGTTEVDISGLMGTPGVLKIFFKLPLYDESTANELAKIIKETLDNFNNEKLVLILDEFAEVIWKIGSRENKKDQYAIRKAHAAHLLSTIRMLHQDRNSEAKYRIVLAGSVNIEETAKFLQVSEYLNHLQRLKVPNLNQSQAADLFFLLTDSNDILLEQEKNEVAIFLEKQFGNVSPFYIQCYAELLKNIILQQKEGYRITQSDLKQCVKQLLTDTHRGLNWLKGRISKYYPDQEKIILSILESIAKFQFPNGKGISEEEIFIGDKISNKMSRLEKTELLQKLISDDFISYSGDKHIAIPSKLALSYWNYKLVNEKFLYDT